MKLHIGHIIEKKNKEKNIGPTELGRKLHTSKQNIYAIYKRESIDTMLLFQLSKVLKYDFFELYSEKINTNPLDDLTLEQKYFIQAKEVEMLKEIIEILKK